MKIFDNNKPKRKKYKRGGLSDQEKSDRAASMKAGLHPMAYPFLALRAGEDKANEWVTDTFSVLNDNPHRLTEKWVKAINSWTEQLVKGMSLDEPDVPEGDRVSLGPYKIMKILPPKMESEYPTSAIMSIDDRGWKWYFKSTKTHLYQVGEYIKFTATISSHKEGITFLKRASKIEVVAKIIEQQGDS